MVYFNPIECVLFPIIGGILISISSSLNLYLKGRITGISGILYNLWFQEDKDNNYWRWSFIYSLLTCSMILAIIDLKYFYETQDIFVKDLSTIGYCLSGLLVGFGTKLANGCTSGHGVCGLPRFSKRSMVAVACFFLSAIALATFRHYVPFLDEKDIVIKAHLEVKNNYIIIDYIYRGSFLGVMSGCYIIYIIIIICFRIKKNKNENLIACSNNNNTDRSIFKPKKDFFISDILLALLTGGLFGIGLVFSGMVKRNKVTNFLTMYSNWDPSLLFIFGTVVAINIITFNLIIKKVKFPKYCSKELSLPNNKIDLKLVFGSIIFGLGWGLGGMCPGPAIIDGMLFIPILVCFYVLFIVGQYFAQLLNKCTETTNKLNKINSIKVLNNNEELQNKNKNNNNKENLDIIDSPYLDLNERIKK